MRTPRAERCGAFCVVRQPPRAWDGGAGIPPRGTVMPIPCAGPRSPAAVPLCPTYHGSRCHHPAPRCVLRWGLRPLQRLRGPPDALGPAPCAALRHPPGPNSTRATARRPYRRAEFHRLFRWRTVADTVHGGIAHHHEARRSLEAGGYLPAPTPLHPRRGVQLDRPQSLPVVRQARHVPAAFAGGTCAVPAVSAVPCRDER